MRKLAPRAWVLLACVLLGFATGASAFSDAAQADGSGVSAGTIGLTSHIADGSDCTEPSGTAADKVKPSATLLSLSFEHLNGKYLLRYQHGSALWLLSLDDL